MNPKVVVLSHLFNPEQDELAFRFYSIVVVVVGYCLQVLKHATRLGAVLRLPLSGAIAVSDVNESVCEREELEVALVPPRYNFIALKF